MNRVNWIERKGYDSNIYLIQDELNLMIDSGTGRNLESVLRELDEIGTGPEELDLLVNTHCHFDHAGGDQDFMEASGCDLLASKFTAEALESADGELTLADQFGGDMEPLDVDRILEGGDEIDLGDTTLGVLETPGHTKGSISLYDPREEALFSGDAVFRGGIGRTDLPSSDPRELYEALKRLAGMEIEKLYPGHGPTAEEGGERYIQKGLRFFR